jgi:predicted AAA+ superfamily ATPase
MFSRFLRADVERALERQAAVVLTGLRQVGKTTLALDVGSERDSVYLDLEDSADRARLADLRTFFDSTERQLVILDEIHRMPGLFPELRGAIDRGRRRGRRHGRFLLLGSASLDVLLKAGESLAGRVAYLELAPLTVLEGQTARVSADRLWLRGGIPDSLSARSDAESLVIRRDLIRAYLTRDVPMLNPRLAVETVERLWTMLAHAQGTVLNQSRLAMNLSLSVPTISRYLDLLVDLLLVRRLPPVGTNASKRLVKSPKVYLRDSGLVHALLQVEDLGTLLGHPVVGASWEGFVIENLLACAPPLTQAGFYRTLRGAEMDLVLDLPGGERWGVEVKRGQVPTLGPGFHNARADLECDAAFVVHSGPESFPLASGVEATSLPELCRRLREWGGSRGAR